MFGRRIKQEAATKEDVEKLSVQLHAIDLQVGDLVRMMRTLVYKLDIQTDSTPTYLDDGAKDELYDKVEVVVRECGKASTALLQRKFRIGYGRAARLIDQLEENGVIGPAGDGTLRTVLPKEDKETV